MGFAHHSAHLLANFWVRHIDWLRDEPQPFGVTAIPATHHDLVHIMGAMIVIDERDLTRFGSRQDPRGDAGVKVKLGHRRLNLFAHFRTDIGVVVQHAADRLYCYPRQRRDIADIGPFAHQENSFPMAANSEAKRLSRR